MNKELKGSELMFTALLMLMGTEDKDFCYYIHDDKWWRDRLDISRN